MINFGFMPVTQVLDINGSVSFALWKIEESLDDLIELYPFNIADRAILDQHKVEARKMEWLSARLALKVLLERKGLAGENIYKDDCGKPHLSESSAQISISHTRGYGAAVLNLSGPTGIDIEFPRPQIQTIARKFLHADEKAWTGEDMLRLTQVWSAKEALYKLHGRTQLIFATQLFVHKPQEDNPANGLIIEDGRQDSFQLSYHSSQELIICVAF